MLHVVTRLSLPHFGLRLVPAPSPKREALLASGEECLAGVPARGAGELSSSVPPRPPQFKAARPSPHFVPGEALPLPARRRHFRARAGDRGLRLHHIKSNGDGDRAHARYCRSRFRGVDGLRSKRTADRRRSCWSALT
ncbi:hypothetical protein ACU4GD_29985 [Cupriavidus basilensis]